MQINCFPDGGFAIHKQNDKGHISAWYKASGKLLDAEFVYRNGRTRPVKHNGPIWRELSNVGLRHAELATS